MRVLHVISDSNIGGAGVLLTTLLRHMDRSKVESVVAIPRGSLLEGRLRALDVPIRFLTNACDRFSSASVGEIKHIIKEEKIDLVHANAALSARIAGKLSHKLVVHTRHCCFPPTGIWKSKAVSFLGGRCNDLLSDRIIATAEAAAENLRLLGIPQKSIELILNGSEPVRAVSEEKLEELRHAFHLTKEDFCIGICARLEEYKGHDVFLKAAKRVLEQYPHRSIRFLVIGDGSQRLTVEHLSESLGISEFVRFTGFVEDMAPIYRLLRINVNCSRGTETSCLALSEGMSAGVPFVASDFGGNRAMWGESMAGMLFPIDDDGELARCICKILSEPALEETMRAAAYARYQQQYTAEQMSDHLTAVYEELYQIKYAKRGLQP